MEISPQQIQPNKEIIPKNQSQNLNESSVAPQNKEGNVAIENSEQNINIQNLAQDEANVLVQNQGMSFKEQLDKLEFQNSIYDFSFGEDFACEFSLSTTDLKEDDINFFLDIIEKKKNNQIIQDIGLIPIVNTTSQPQNVNETQNVQAAEKIMQIIDISAKSEKPVRIDFDNQITVVLKVDRDGKINAQFYPGDKAAEEYLRNNIQNLRNTFDEKNILYSYLDYKQNRGNNGKERKEKQ